MALLFSPCFIRSSLSSSPFPVQSSDARVAAKPLLPAGHFGDGEDGAHGGGCPDAAAQRYRALRPTVLRSHGDAGVALVSNGSCGAGAHHSNGIDGLSTLRNEKARTELPELRGAGRSARAVRSVRRRSGDD